MFQTPSWAQLICTDYAVQCNDPEKINTEFEREIEYIAAPEMPGGIFGASEKESTGNTWIPFNIDACFRDSEILKDIKINLNLISNTVYHVQITLHPPTSITDLGFPNTILLGDFGETGSTNTYSAENKGLATLLESTAISGENILSKTSVDHFTQNSSDEIPSAYGSTWFVRVSHRGEHHPFFGEGEITSASIQLTTGFPSPIFENRNEFQNISLVEEKAIEGACIAGSWQNKKVEKTYSGLDANMNIQTCKQIITIEGPVLGEINLPQDITLTCQDFTSSAEVSFELLNDFNNCFDLKEDFSNYCNLFVVWEDIETPLCGGTKLSRNWTFGNLCSGEILEHEQTISFVDDEPPLIPDQLSFDFKQDSCTSIPITLEMLEIYDNCSGVDSVISKYLISGNPYLGNDQYEYNNLSKGESIKGLALGNSTIEITAVDHCGNKNVKDVELTINNNQPPTIVLKENLVFTLNNDGYWRIFIDDIDAGSYHNCRSFEMLMKRANGVPSEWAEKIDFNILDLGFVNILVRAIDDEGNESYQNVGVKVRRKRIQQPPRIPVVLQYKIEKEQSAEDSFLENHPNPFHNETKICLTADAEFENDLLEVYDVSGNLILQKPISKSETCVWLDKIDLGKPGIYFYKLKEKGLVNRLLLLD